MDSLLCSSDRNRFCHPVKQLLPRQSLRKPIREVFGEKQLPNMFFIEPLEYLSFVYLMEKSTIVLTDSGGIQEEAPGLGKPVLVMRENTMIAGNCYIVSNDHDIYTTLSVRDSGHIVGDIYIGNNVWIGANVVITKGVHIGDGAIIGAGSVVTKDIPSMSIAYGVPCRVVSDRVLKNE